MLPLLAQTPAARLVGDVRDSSGAVVPGTTITVRSVETNETRTAKTNAEGEYSLPNLQPGRYDAGADAPGFRRVKQTGIELQVGQTARMDFTLEVGAVSETIEVAAQLPVVNTENAVKGDVVVNQEIANMPLNGRDFFELGLLVPGVAQKQEGPWMGGDMAANGARPDNTNFVVDGFNNYNQRGGQTQTRPPLDAMQEFKVETSGYSAEFGRLAGGVVNMALKTGGNRFHGALFEFLRNDKLDARNFFADDTSKLRRNQFGATLSGPVKIPKLYNGKDRTFFLFSWESYRQSQGNVHLMRVPTDLERIGDFSQTLTAQGKVEALKDPLSTAACTAPGGGGCFPGNRLPASRIHPASAILRSYYPAPNLPGQANNYRVAAVTTNIWNSFLYKADHRLTEKDTLSFRFMNRGDSNVNPFGGSELGTFAATDRPRSALGGLNYTRMFVPTIINEFRFGFSRSATSSAAAHAGQNIAAELGIPGTTTDPQLLGFPKFKITNMPDIGDDDQAPNRWAINTFEFGDTVTWVKERHTVKMGGSVLREQVNQLFTKNVRGTYNFIGRLTNDSFADFLLGMMNGTTRGSGAVPIYVRTTDAGAFVQDDFRVTSNLTLNLGTRYEYAVPLAEKYGRMAGFVPEVNALVVVDSGTLPDFQKKVSDAGLTGLVGVASDYSLPRALTYSSKKRLAPRAGFAWRPWGGNRAVIRGSYGIFYSGSANNQIRLDLANVFPFAGTETFTRDPKRPELLSFSNPYPAEISKTAGVKDVYGQELYPASPYLQIWNLTVEKQVNSTTALEIGYTGSKGTHLGSRINSDTPDTRPGMRLPDGTYPKPFPQFNSIKMYLYDSNSTYNAGMVSLRRRFANNFFYRLNYTLSKSLDYASLIQGQGAGGGGNLDPRNRRLDHGRSSWDALHVFTATFSYEMPRRYGRLLGRWQLAGSGRMTSGRPFSPSVSNAQVDQGEGDRPDRIASGVLANPTPERWFDVSAFPVVPLGSQRFGTSGRNILNGPGLASLNFALMKKFPIRELGTLQFRAEAFNATNHTNFNMPNRNVNALTAGVIDAAGPARIFQAALRFDF
jgi:hypothetical protein